MEAAESGIELIDDVDGQDAGIDMIRVLQGDDRSGNISDRRQVAADLEGERVADPYQGQKVHRCKLGCESDAGGQHATLLFFIAASCHLRRAILS
jgi:hypothetical protein